MVIPKGTQTEKLAYGPRLDSLQTGIVTLLLQNPALLKANAGAEEKLSSQADLRNGLGGGGSGEHTVSVLNKNKHGFIIIDVDLVE